MNSKIILSFLFLMIVVFGVGVVSGIGTYPNIDPSMVLYYHFNNQSAYGENDTYVYDFSSNGNNGTNNNSLFIINSGILNDGSFSFNGINSSIDIPYSNSLNITSYLTISSLVYINNNTIAQEIINNGGASGWELRYDGVNRFVFKYNNGNTYCSTSSSNNIQNWYLITATYNSTTAICYSNGVSGTPTVNSKINGTSGMINIGKRATTTFFNGLIDEVIVWNRTLSNGEIWGLYNRYNGVINLSNDFYNMSYINNTLGLPNLLWYSNGFWYINTSIYAEQYSLSNLTFAPINEKIFLIGNNNIDLNDNSGSTNISIIFSNTTITGDKSLNNRGYLRFTNSYIYIYNSNFTSLGENSTGEKGGLYLKNLYNKLGSLQNISNSYFDDLTDCLYADDQGNLSINNNSFNNCIYGAIEITHSNDINIFNNNVNNVLTQNGIDLAWVSNSSIHDNYVYNTGHNSYAFRNDLYNLKIFNNYAYNTTHHLYDFYTSGDSSLVDFYNNIGNITYDSNAIYIRNLSYSNFSNSIMNDFFLYGISIDTTSKNIIINNISGSSSQINSSRIFSRDSMNLTLRNIGFSTKSQVYALFNTTKNISFSSNCSVFDLINPLIFNEDLSKSYSKINNINLSFINGSSYFILDNFNLTEGISRQYSPIWFSSSTSTEKHIASNLSNGVNVLTILSPVDLDCNQISIITYTPHGGITSTYNGNEAKNYCTQLTTIGDTITISPSSESNIFTFSYGAIPTGICNNILNVSTLTASQIVMVFIIIIFGVILSIIMFSIGFVNEKINPYVIGSIFIAILIGAIILGISALITTSLCSL